MTDVTETATIKPGSWRELLGRERIGTATLLAGGVGLYATNEFLTISLLPSTVADIGGQRFYAWVIAVYLVCCGWPAPCRARPVECSQASATR